MLIKFNKFYLGIELYLFVSLSGMKESGMQSAFRNLHVDPLSFITLLEKDPRKQVMDMVKCLEGMRVSCGNLYY